MHSQEHVWDAENPPYSDRHASVSPDVPATHNQVGCRSIAPTTKSNQQQSTSTNPQQQRLVAASTDWHHHVVRTHYTLAYASAKKTEIIVESCRDLYRQQARCSAQDLIAEPVSQMLSQHLDVQALCWDLHLYAGVVAAQAASLSLAWLSALPDCLLLDLHNHNLLTCKQGYCFTVDKHKADFARRHLVHLMSIAAITMPNHTFALWVHLIMQKGHTPSFISMRAMTRINMTCAATAP